MDVSIVVCTHGRPQLLPGLLEAVAANLVPPGPEVLFVDSASPEPVEPLVRELAPRFPRMAIRCIRLSTAGESRARNAGIAEARGELVAFVDDDARPRPGWLPALLSGFSEGEQVVAVGGPVVLQWPDGSPPRWLSPSLERWFSGLDLGPEPCALSDGRFLFGSNLALRRRAGLEVGGFAEPLERAPGNLMSGGEVHLQRRLRRSGLTVRYEPGAVVDHCVLPDRRSPRWVVRRAYWQGRGEAVADRLDNHRIDAALGARRIAAHLVYRSASDARAVLLGDNRPAALLDFVSRRATALGYALETLRRQRATSGCARSSSP